MKTLHILEPASQRALELSLQKMGRSRADFINQQLPQEDFVLVSKKYPIYAVADGVTLIQYILDKDKNEYPDPSPAGEVARIFCEAFVAAAEERYENFNEVSLKEAFVKGNQAVAEYSKAHGREKGKLDYWDTDLYAATVACMVYKDGKVYWGSVCDAYFFKINKDGALAFMSPQCHSLAQAKPPRFTGDPSDKKARAIYAWSMTRNGINEKGERIGYGVVTGEPEAAAYFCSGIVTPKEGDVIGIISDGFEEYLQLPEFRSLLAEWPSDLKERIQRYTQEMSEKDPEKFGHERSLVVISQI